MRVVWLYAIQNTNAKEKIHESVFDEYKRLRTGLFINGEKVGISFVK